MTRRATWAVLIAAVVFFGGVLSLYRATDAAPPNPPVPLGNAVEQRIEMIGHLKEIVSQLREQNKLLRGTERPAQKRQTESRRRPVVGRRCQVEVAATLRRGRRTGSRPRRSVALH